MIIDKHIMLLGISTLIAQLIINVISFSYVCGLVSF